VTGAAHHLEWFIFGLMSMVPVTYTIQELALRVAIATQMPYSHLLRVRFGRWWTAVNGIVLHLLNALILVTEFLGMTSALHLIGFPWWSGVVISWGLVIGVTAYRHYPSLERLLLIMAIFNFAFIPALITLHPDPHAWQQAFGGSLTSSIFFLLLALAGNAIAPWMIYWQQNAVWSGNVPSLSFGRKDIRLGVLAQVVMAAIVMLIGALAKGSGSALANPLQWLWIAAGPVTGRLFALGIFDAGFLAACTISLSSAWMLSEVLHGTPPPRAVTPTGGRSRWIHIFTLTIAAICVMWPNLSIGSIALWAQALGALWMPISLIMLIVIGRDIRLMGPLVIRRRRLIALIAIVVLFVTLAALSGLF
jgi:Mn2+/Fe2+ NRAMP family transporter